MTGQPMQQGVAALAVERGQHGSGTNHDMVDLWLAVMCAAVGLVVTAWVLRAVRSVAFPLVARVSGRSRARLPLLRLGRDILLTTCARDGSPP
jgi:hypothetical protein